MNAVLPADAGAQAFAPASVPAAVSAAASAAIDANTIECRPAYPEAALRARAQGTSHIAFLVDATGKVSKGGVIESSGKRPEHRLLDQSALYSLSKCPFKPARDVNGQPVEGIVEIRYTWRIE